MFFVEYSTGKGNFSMPKPTKEEAENFTKLIKSLKGLHFTRIREDKETITVNTEKPKTENTTELKIEWGRIEDY